jgi:thiosulfate/3-mercaptopyruvate sulfurtransferase
MRLHPKGGRVDDFFMKQVILSIAIVLAAFSFPILAAPRSLPPIVSTTWLSQNLQDPRIIVLDIRGGEPYGKGHIPGSISAPLKLWAIASGGLTLELPADEALAELLGKFGIADGASKLIVIAGRTETDFGRADATRVAWTCMLAGLKNVAVLDGGYTKWAKEDRPRSTDAAVPAPLKYQGIINRSTLATKSHVQSRLGRAIILDARVPEDYFGITSKPGHIKGAVNLPTPWVFSPDGTFKQEAELRAMISGVLGQEKSKEVLVYCGVGGYASTWWYLLTQVFGYADVKVYDGSIEEWLKDATAPVSTYTWH